MRPAEPRGSRYTFKRGDVLLMQRVTLNLFYLDGKPRGGGYRGKLSAQQVCGERSGPIPGMRTKFDFKLGRKNNSPAFITWRRESPIFSCLPISPKGSLLLCYLQRNSKSQFVRANFSGQTGRFIKLAGRTTRTDLCPSS